MISSNKTPSTIFNGPQRKTFEETQRAKMKDLTDVEKFWTKFKKFGKWTLYVAAALLLVVIIFDFIIGSYIYSLVDDFASDYHWLSRFSGFIAVTFAIAFSFPLLWAMATCLVGMGKAKHWATLALCVILTILGAYNSKYQYFASGAGEKEICPPLIVNEKIKIDSKGVGAKYGKVCVPLTQANVSLAYAIEKNSLAPKEFFIFAKELHSLKLMKNGVPTLYRGATLTDGTFRLYEGPWFDEDRKGEFTKPVLNIEELRPLHKLVHDKSEKEALAIEALEAEREGQMAAAEERRQEQLKKEEAKLATKKKVREKKLFEAKQNEKLVGLSNVSSYQIPESWRISVKGKHVELKVGNRDVTREFGDDLFIKNNGKVVAVPMNCIWCSEVWLKIERIVPD